VFLRGRRNRFLLEVLPLDRPCNNTSVVDSESEYQGAFISLLLPKVYSCSTVILNLKLILIENKPKLILTEALASTPTEIASIISR